MIPWKLSCDQGMFNRQQMFELSSRGLQSAEPMEEGLLWASLWVLISSVCPSSSEAVVITWVVGSIVAGAISIKPFIKYAEYLNLINEDLEFFNNGDLQMLSECSTAPYEISSTVITDLQSNRKSALFFLIFYGIWLCFAIFIPVLAIIMLILGALCACGAHHMSRNCREMGAEFKAIFKHYKHFN